MQLMSAESGVLVRLLSRLLADHKEEAGGAAPHAWLLDDCALRRGLRLALGQGSLLDVKAELAHAILAEVCAQVGRRAHDKTAAAAAISDSCG
jgi:hypothetical protein